MAGHYELDRRPAKAFEEVEVLLTRNTKYEMDTLGFEGLDQKIA